MNETLIILMNRRSVRFFTEEPVGEDVIERIVAAGHAAPSGSGRNWRFIVVTDPVFRAELLEKARPRYETMLPGFPEAFQAVRHRIDGAVEDSIYYGAPAAVFVVAGGPSADADGNLACANIITAAGSEGLGSCYVWFGSLPLDDADVCARMGLSEDERVFGPVVLGHPAPEQPPAAPKGEPTVVRI